MTRIVTFLAYAALAASLGLGFLVVTAHAHAAQPAALVAGPLAAPPTPNI